MRAVKLLVALCAVALSACSTVSQVAQDEAALPPTAAAVADAYGALKVAGALGQQVCMVTATLPQATCIRMQGQLLSALKQIEAVETLVNVGSASATDASTLAAAQAVIAQVVQQLQAVQPKVQNGT